MGRGCGDGSGAGSLVLRVQDRLQARGVAFCCALRHPTDRWPSDGVANIRPLQSTSSAPEGLY